MSVSCRFCCRVRCQFYIPIILIFTIFFRDIYSSDNESNGRNGKKYKSKNGTITDKVRKFLGVCCREIEVLSYQALTQKESKCAHLSGKKSSSRIVYVVI